MERDERIAFYVGRLSALCDAKVRTPKMMDSVTHHYPHTVEVMHEFMEEEEMAKRLDSFSDMAPGTMISLSNYVFIDIDQDDTPWPQRWEFVLHCMTQTDLIHSKLLWS